MNELFRVAFFFRSRSWARSWKNSVLDRRLSWRYFYLKSFYYFDRLYSCGKNVGHSQFFNIVLYFYDSLLSFEILFYLFTIIWKKRKTRKLFNFHNWVDFFVFWTNHHPLKTNNPIFSLLIFRKNSFINFDLFFCLQVSDYIFSLFGSNESA